MLIRQRSGYLPPGAILRIAICDRDPGDRTSYRTRADVENSSTSALYGQAVGSGAGDGHVVGNLKFAAGQHDSVGDAGGVNRVAIVCVSQRLAQRAGSTVIRVCDDNEITWRCNSLGEHEWNYANSQQQ